MKIKILTFSLILSLFAFQVNAVVDQEEKEAIFSELDRIEAVEEISFQEFIEIFDSLFREDPEETEALLKAYIIRSEEQALSEDPKKPINRKELSDKITASIDPWKVNAIVYLSGLIDSNKDIDLDMYKKRVAPIIKEIFDKYRLGLYENFNFYPNDELEEFETTFFGLLFDSQYLPLIEIGIDLGAPFSERMGEERGGASSRGNCNELE